MDASMPFSRMAPGFQGSVVAPRTKLVREIEKPVTLTPSAFQEEMSLTTKQRLARTREMRLPQVVQISDMSETSHHKFSSIDLDQTLFQPFPSEVVFQNYVPHKVYEMPLVLTNRDKVPHMLKVTMENSPYFKLVGANSVFHMVPPGMTSTLQIHFTPEENKDYFHQVLCITDRENLIVPIRAIGSRAVLDFPDQLDFSVCPVNYNTRKTLQVHNVGNREAQYRISTQSPFSVSPDIGCLGIGDSMQVTVEFHPLQTGDHSASLVVHYDTGEDIHTSLHGTAVNVHIGLDRNSVTVEKTYLTLSSHGTVVIYNRSNVPAHFQWRAFATQEEEDWQRLRLCRQQKDKVDDFLKECRVDSSRREFFSHLPCFFQRERTNVQGDSMLFSDSIFTIEPVEGEICPNSSAEITVIFKPQEARVYEQTAYCDISGCETRLPLHLTGEGLGPKLCFNFDELDIGDVYIRTAYSYEVILFNKGPLEAAFSLVPPTTAVGSCFTFLPQEGIIAPDGVQAIQISFRSPILGKLKETFQFSVTGSPKPVTLTIRGYVIGPTLHFNVPALSFGDVSFGFPRTLSCRMTNTSLVPMTFNLRVPEDGSGGPSLRSFDQIAKTHRAQGLAKPREFTIRPYRGTISSQGYQDIQVTLCSNTVGVYKLLLVVDVEDVGEEVFTLLLTARCVIPPLQVLNPVITFGRCCLKFPYHKTVTLVNDSDLPGCYRVLPQEHKEAAAVWYCVSNPCGIIEAHSSVEIPFTLEAQSLGENVATVAIAVFGNEGSPLKIHLVSTGEGPVVYVRPSEINFGSIQVLQDTHQTLHLSNQSVIPAEFWAVLTGKHSCWRIEPSKGVIPPESEVVVRVIANLDGAKNFKDEVKLFIQNSYMSAIPIQAVGIGTTIVFDKPFAPELSYGPHFSLIPCSYQFKVTNKGRSLHRLYWTTEAFRPFQQHHCLPDLSITQGKDVSQMSYKSNNPVFTVQPPYMELMPGETTEVVLKGFTSTPQEVKERLLCHAVVGREIVKQQIMQVDVTCKFISPAVQMSSRKIVFRLKHPRDALTLQYKPLSLKNTSALPVSIMLELEQPFLICDVEQQPLPADVQPMKLEVGEELHLCIGFDPSCRSGLNTWAEEKTLKMRFMEHPHEQQITVRGEVYFPNVHIHPKAVDFGCILNDTEQVRFVEMTNSGRVPALYHWTLQTYSQVTMISRSPSELKPSSLEEGACLESSVSSGRHSRAGGVEEPISAPGAVQDSAQQPSGAEAKVLPPTTEEPQSPVELKRFGEAEPIALAEEAEPLDLAEEEVSLALAEEEDSLPSGAETETPSFGWDQVFEVLPRFGVLQPGKSQEVKFIFFGKRNVVTHAVMRCQVEKGPTREVMLSGKSASPSYHLNVQEINCGLQLFIEVIKTEITLLNTGFVGFTYTALSPSTATAANPLPGVPLVLPSTGHLEPGEKQVLKVYFLPGVPGVFCKTFQVKVGNMAPAEITLKGEGLFPRISLNLPRNIKGNEKYEKILKMTKEKLGKDKESDEDVALREEGVAMAPPMEDSDTMMEMEQMLLEQHALEIQRVFFSFPQKHRVFDCHARESLVKAELPEYILDVGDITRGEVFRCFVTVTNTGPFQVSFQVKRNVLHDTGFTVDLDQVQDLPYSDSKTFEVLFDSANMSVGEVDVLLPIQVKSGPTFHIRLHANVGEPFTPPHKTCNKPRKHSRRSNDHIRRKSGSNKESFDSSGQR